MAILCVPLTGRTADEMLAVMRALPPFVQAVEARMDYMAGDIVRLAAQLEALCRGKDRTLIVTVRPKREGGLWDGPEPQRLDLLRRACALGAEYIDVELDSVAALGGTSGSTRRIVSHHNFQQTPADLEALHRQAAAAGADVVKITVTARDIADTLPVFALLKRHAARVPTIALSMGEEGLPTRVLASKFGGFLTYASLEAGKGSAPGQVPWHDMEQMYRFHRIGPATPVYGVVANPVAHSMSPAIQNAAFAELDMDAVYLPFKVAEPKAFLDGYQPLDLRGLSVTIPHKEAMLALMDETDELSRRVGAVNTVDIRGGRRYGSNTDVAAALAALTGAAERAGLLPLARRTVLLVGAGGAGRALAYGLAGQAGRLFIANRTASRAERLAADVGADTCGLDEIGTLRPDVLINTTSVGMHPKVDDTPVPAAALRKGMVVFDAVYNPIETRLLREAREAGCVTASGFDWFVSQAAAQFETWTGRRAPRDIMADVVRRRLSRA